MYYYNRKNFRSLWVSILLSLVSGVLGTYINGFEYAMLLTIALGALLIISLLANLIGSRLLTKKLEKRTERENLNELLALHEKAKENYPAETRKISIAVILSIAYIVISLASAIGFCIFSSAWLGYTPLLVIGLYFVFCTVDRMYCISFRPVQMFTISEHEYPKIFEIIKDVRKTYGLEGSRLFILPQNDCNAGVAEVPGGYILMLGVPLGSILSREEFRQVMLHEFAHIANRDTKIGLTSSMLITFMTEKSKNPVGVINGMYKYASLKYREVYSKYRISASFVAEQNADAAVAKHGNAKLNVEALAKINTYWFYGNEDNSNIYAENESLPEHVCSLNVRRFKDMFEKRCGEWKSYMALELPAQLNSHPTFNQRREAAGIDDFELSPASNDTAYRDEWAKMAKFLDTRIRDVMKQDYAKKRRRAYLGPKATVEKYDSSDKNPTATGARGIIRALISVGRRDEALELCEKIIASDCSEFEKAYPLFTAGAEHLRRYDAKGIEYTYRAMEINSRYVSKGLDNIGNFSRRMGLKDELESYRASSPERMQEIKETWGKASILKFSDKLSIPKDISNDDIKKYINGVLSHAGQNIKAIYLFKKHVRPDFDATIIVIRFVKGLKDEYIDEKMFAIAGFFESLPPEPNFTVFLHSHKLFLPLLKASGSKIYKK